MNKSASELGKLGRDIPKTLSPEQREAKAERMRALNRKRKLASRRKSGHR